MIKQLYRRHLQFVKNYYSDIYLYFTHFKIERLKLTGQLLGIFLFSAVTFFILINNLTPFGITMRYSLGQNSKTFSTLGPKDRVDQIGNKDNIEYKVKGNLVYFTTTVPFDFDSASVKIYYKNINPNQTIALGYQSNKDWKYEFRNIDIPALNKLNWIRNGYETVLYQRVQRYKSVDEFLNDPPYDGIIGTYEYETEIGSKNSISVKSYRPKAEDTLINVPLRGSHTIYAYLKNEPFNMKISKQDLNWYQGSDEMTVKIFKGKDLVYETMAQDDGIIDASKKVLHPITMNIKNPSKNLPEPGVYKIVIEANPDTVINSISTNLHKIVFANKIFPVNNESVYNKITSSTIPTTVYTNTLAISANTNHIHGLQDIIVNNQVLGLNTVKTQKYLVPKDMESKVIIPQNDVILNGFMGYFAFDKDQFFLPSKYFVMPIRDVDDIKVVDYIITDYRPASENSGWTVNEQYFDLEKAYVNENKLSWVIKAPGLQENNRNYIIKEIQVTYHKKPWLKL